jgi:hypothetical protein
MRRSRTSNCHYKAAAEESLSRFPLVSLWGTQEGIRAQVSLTAVQDDAKPGSD